NMKDVTPATLLAQAAKTLGGRWQVLYHLSTQESPSAAPVPSGVALKLSLPDVSCQAAASLVAKMAGGRVERDGDLTGQVSLEGTAIPVEEAMDAIARAAKASWRRIYVMRVDALPQALPPRTADPSAAKDPEQSPKPKRKADPKQWSSHPSLT